MQNPLNINHASMPIPFAKMHGLGNDFIILMQKDLEMVGYSDSNKQFDVSAELSQLALTLCDRHYGIGADGLIIVRDAERTDCDFSWLYINSDGSHSLMCGNGLRSLALWAVETEFTHGHEFVIETGVGPVLVSVESQDEITLELKEPVLESTLIPVSGPSRPQVIRESLHINGTEFKASCISVGNPHCVIFNPPIDTKQYSQFAPKIQNLDFFPDGVNVEFVEVLSSNKAKVYVWERGCGPTLACASGACAVLVAGVLEGRLDPTSEIVLPGGSLFITWSKEDRRIRLKGPARHVFSGIVDLSNVNAKAFPKAPK